MAGGFTGVRRFSPPVPAAVALAVACAALIVPACKKGGGKGGKKGDPALHSLPYLNFSEVDDKAASQRGVTIYEEQLAWRGLNLHAIRTRGEALLTDMRGQVVHRWENQELVRAPIQSELPFVEQLVNVSEGWTHVEPGENGQLYVVVELDQVGKIDRDGALLWKRQNHAHHDVFLSSDGKSLYTLTAERRDLQLRGMTVPIIDEHIAVLDAETGEPMQRISLHDLFKGDAAMEAVLQERIKAAADYVWSLRNHKDAKRSPDRPETPLQLFIDFVGFGRGPGFTDTEELLMLVLCAADVFHTNSIEVVPAHPSGLWPAGSILLSVRNMNSIVVIDPADKTVKWSWGRAEIGWQHDATMLQSGNILLFDNAVGTTQKSRAIEVDPTNGRIVWSYPKNEKDAFYSGAMGGAQRLAGGTTLITDAMAGRAFEVAPDGQVVWHYRNPERLSENDKFIGTIYRVNRFPVERFPEFVSEP